VTGGAAFNVAALPCPPCGPWTKPNAQRVLLYYAYAHPWMVGSDEHWRYPKSFYNEKLSPEQRKLFHGFVFDPPEMRRG
jgi:hypothetical protein